MTLPIENVLVFYPPTVKVDGVVLGPLTIGGAVALDALGVDPISKVSPEQALVAAAVLEDGCAHASEVLREHYDFKGLAKRLNNRFESVAVAVNGILSQAWETYVKPMQKTDGVQHVTPHGLGWPLELAEAICEIFGWTFEYVRDIPVVKAWALVAANRQYNGGSHGGFDYVERQYAKELKKKKAEKNG